MGKHKVISPILIVLMAMITIISTGHALTDVKPEPYTDPLNIALAANGAVVHVDSSFPNYNAIPLNDGYRNEEFLTWQEVAWASSVQGDHWVEVAFPELKMPKTVDIYWAFDTGEYYASQAVAIQVKVNGDWITVETLVIANPNTAVSSIELDGDIETAAIRLFQEEDQGPGNYTNPNIMWISEIEIYE